MPYLPGPLKLQTAENVGIETRNYNFAGDAHDQLNDVDVIPGSWANFFQDAGILLDEPADPFPDVDLNSAIDVMGTYAEPSIAMGLNALVSSYGVADSALAQAFGNAPPEAFVDMTTQFIPPAPAETLQVPVISSDAVKFDVTGQVGDGGRIPVPVNAPLSHSASLTNLTAYGSSLFSVGDQWQLVAIGQAGEDVTVSGTFNDQEFAPNVVGKIQSDGTFKLPGVMDYASIGTWHQNWDVGPWRAAVIDFVVVE